ncbi:chorismate synthase [bacterium SCSIO 12741]|nr:chorismate synthase [bacterium SCSIO 12741]
MAGNSLGKLFRLSTFGESHGKAIGGVIDGCPSGLVLDMDAIQKELDRRKPGQSALTTPRKESDQVEFLSGIMDGTTLGTPIGFILRNEDKRSKDYSDLEKVYRPSHADYTYDQKFGIRDHRGGGRSSARETANWVVGGAIARQLLQHHGVRIRAYVSQIGSVSLSKNHSELNLEEVDHFLSRCPDAKSSALMEAEIEAARDAGDSLGGIISLVVEGLPTGWGEPVFEKLHAVLGQALFSINATKGVEFGSGFSAASIKGSEHNDAFVMEDGQVSTKTNHSGGVQGGLSNGMDLLARVAFKPTASIKKQQQTVNAQGESKTLEIQGRHDPCVVPRAVPIVEAMAALVLADFSLMARTNKLEA